MIQTANLIQVYIYEKQYGKESLRLRTVHADKLLRMLSSGRYVMGFRAFGAEKKGPNWNANNLRFPDDDLPADLKAHWGHLYAIPRDTYYASVYHHRLSRYQPK